jgi:hypothetical protein
MQGDHANSGYFGQSAATPGNARLFKADPGNPLSSVGPKAILIEIRLHFGQDESATPKPVLELNRP